MASNNTSTEASLWSGLASGLAARGYTFSPLRQSRSQYLAASLNALASSSVWSAYRQSFEELVAGLVNQISNTSINSKNLSRSALLALAADASASSAPELAIIARAAQNSNMMAVLANRSAAYPIAGDGAAGSNTSGYKHSTEQRFSLWTLLYGIATNNEVLVERVIDAMEYGFATQTGSGNFSNTLGYTAAQAVGSDAFFMQFACHADELLLLTPYGVTYSARLTAMRNKWALARSFLSTNQVELYNQDDANTNRLFFDAGAFMIGGSPHQFVELAVATQHATGYFPEDGGWDSSYNCVSMLRLAELLLYSDGLTTNQRNGMLTSLQKAAAWQASRIEGNGHVVETGNTRTGNGNPLQVNYYEVALSMYYVANVLNDAVYATIGDAVAAYVVANS